MEASPPYPANSGFAGIKDVHADNSDFNGVSFAARQILNKASTATLVQIVAVTNAGGISSVGYVDVRPLVNQIDGAGIATPHGVVRHLPYVRMQGGANAVILDPVIDDIGIAIFADRDISSVKTTGAQANPGSRRRFDMADGLYIGGCLNGTPTQYVAFTSEGLALVSPIAVMIQAPVIDLNGAVNAMGTFTSNGKDVSSTHYHNAPSGGGNTGGPL